MLKLGIAKLSDLRIAKLSNLRIAKLLRFRKYKDCETKEILETLVISKLKIFSKKLEISKEMFSKFKSLRKNVCDFES